MIHFLIFVIVVGYVGWLHFDAIRKRYTVCSAISDLERLNEVLTAGIADRVRVREIIEKLKGAVE